MSLINELFPFKKLSSQINRDIIYPSSNDYFFFENEQLGRDMWSLLLLNCSFPNHELLISNTVDITDMKHFFWTKKRQKTIWSNSCYPHVPFWHLRFWQVILTRIFHHRNISGHAPSGRWTFQHRNVLTRGLFGMRNFWRKEFSALENFGTKTFQHMNILAQ